MARPVGRAQRAYQLPLRVPSVGDYRRIGEPIRRLRRLSVGGRTGNPSWAAPGDPEESARWVSGPQSNSNCANETRRATPWLREILFYAHRVFVRSTQIVMHHFPQPERQVRHAVRCRDYFQDRQLRNWRQRVRCE